MGWLVKTRFKAKSFYSSISVLVFSVALTVSGARVTTVLSIAR